MRLHLAITATCFGFAAAAATQSYSRGIGKRTTRVHEDYPGHPVLPELSQILTRNATSGNMLPLDNIQSDVLLGQKNPREMFYFFKINNPAVFKKVLKNKIHELITSVTTIVGPVEQQPNTFLNVAFTATGLHTLGIKDDLNDPYFSAGQYADAKALGDNLNWWEPNLKGTSTHGVFLLSSDDYSYVNETFAQINNWLGNSISTRYIVRATARPGTEKGHEHFGYSDGISQPAVDGFSTEVLPGQTLLPPGKMLLGREGDLVPRPKWAVDGSFLAFRKLQEMRPEWEQWLLDNALQNEAGNLTKQEGADLLGARIFGRWKSGSPVDLTPDHDDTELGADRYRNNNFDYSHPGSDIDSDQSRCPFSAHSRKMNGRADKNNNTNIENAMLRAGTAYGPEVTEQEQTLGKSIEDRGMAFVGYQSNIKNGFRFQQLQMGSNPDFPYGKTDPTPGQDLIIGQTNGGQERIASGLDPIDQARDYTAAEFIIARGGDYFFSPSISAVRDIIAA